MALFIQCYRVLQEIAYRKYKTFQAHFPCRRHSFFIAYPSWRLGNETRLILKDVISLMTQVLTCTAVGVLYTIFIEYILVVLGVIASRISYFPVCLRPQT